VKQICQWFLRCTNEATGTTPHPILGEVPTCDRCAAFAQPDVDERAAMQSLKGRL
jgi:hypothetical protein